MSQSDYKTKGELMLKKPMNYGIDEYPDVIIELELLGEDDLADDLKEEFVKVLQRRDMDPNEEYDIFEDRYA